MCNLLWELNLQVKSSPFLQKTHKTTNQKTQTKNHQINKETNKNFKTPTQNR